MGIKRHSLYIYHNMEREWDEYVDAHAHLAVKTLQTYKHSYLKLMEGLDHSMAKSNQKDILAYAREVSKTPNTHAQLLNVALQIRRFHNEPTDMMVNARDRVKLEIDARRDQINKVKLDTLPTLPVLKRHMNDLYLNGEFRDYIINYLLITFNTRNKDLDVAIVSSKRDATDPDMNYLILRPAGTLSYVRRSYKTVGRHGVKENTFKSTKVRKAAEAFINAQGGMGNGPVYLLSTGTNKRIGPDSIQKFIRARTYDGLSEGDYNKIAVSTIDHVGDFAALKRVSKNRGTELGNLIEHYHLSFPVAET